MPDAETVSVTINGKPFDVPKGQLVIDAADHHGVYIPRFCYHHRMRPVGMCRMCIVDIDTGRGPALQPACMIAVADDMKVDTATDGVKKAQDGILEFLLINHPLDCPVCDKGGECPLQDQAYAYGPGESRFIEEKRHFEKPIPISALVYLDRERCILCDRCTRFALEVAGDPLISFIDRGNETQVNTFPGDPFASYFSGNTVQICPVGALTAKPYRFRARPWDLDQVESTCTTCSVGCRIVIQSSRNRVLRYLGVDADPINWSWLCDKGRFGFEAVNHEARLSEPLVRRGEWELTGATWAEALTAAAELLESALESNGPSGIAILGGARLTNEAAYAWAKLAKGVIGTDHVDAQVGDGLPAEVVLSLPRATIDETCAAGGTVLLLAPDVKEELPVFYLRLRDAVVNHGVKVVELAPLDTGFTPYATVSLRYRPGEAAELVSRVLAGPTGLEDDEHRAAELLADDGPFTTVLGRSSLAERADVVLPAAVAILEAKPEARFLPALRRANVLGALDMGLAPGVLPGRVGLHDGRAWLANEWSMIPGERGLDAEGVLTAAAEGKIDALVLLGANPLVDFPDRDLASRALAGARAIVAVDIYLNESAAKADVVLAAAGYGETTGSTTNVEGRVSVLERIVTPPGTARDDWIIAAELAYRLGTDLGLESIDDIQREIERLAPSHAGLTPELLSQPWAEDGIVVPLRPDDLARAEGTPVSIEGTPLPVTPEAEIEPAAAADVAVEAEAARAGRPPMLRFTPPAAVAATPPVDSYSLRLVAHRKLYDYGTLTQHAPSLIDLASESVLRMNPWDLDRLGVDAGGRVKVTSPRATVTVGALPDPSVPKGVAAMAVNQRGTSPAELIDAAAPVTEIRVETP
ncbi:MAG: NADH-quinone oxidoreductase subunit NuoG [Acidimicrobiales bacterium]